MSTHYIVPSIGIAVMRAVARRLVHQAQSGQVEAARSDYQQHCTGMSLNERRVFDEAIAYFATLEAPHV